MTPPRAEIVRYLQRCHPDAEVTALAGDASTRRFFRFTMPDGGSRVLMDYGRPFRGETADMVLSRVFRSAGLRVAEVVTACPETGCLELEDLGDRTLQSLISESGGGPGARALLEGAARLAARIAERGSPALARSGRSAGPALDASRFRFEMDHFLEHFVRGLRGRARPLPALREELHRLADLAAQTPRAVMCHRDFHTRNLLALDDGSLAMVDIQDARWGPDSYDLASLLRDPYVEIDESWIDPLVETYLSALAEPPEGALFRHRLDIASAQRMLKALGTYGFQTAVRGSRRYLDAIERAERRLRKLLPALPETRRLHGILREVGLLREG